jgi:hypothetical protein
MMKLLFPVALLLTACASQGDLSSAKPDPGPCKGLAIEECLSLIDQMKMSDRQRVDALMATGAENLSNDNPRAAVSFYDAVIKQDEKNADAYLMRANSNAKLGLQLQQSDGVDRFLAMSTYTIASLDYIAVIALDPDNQLAYLGAVATAAHIGECDIAESVREMHEKKFGQTTTQQELATVIDKKCS